MRKEHLFYCYNCPTSGYYIVNGYKYFYGKDFRVAEKYAEYLDCGFNVVQARGENSYKGEGFSGSDCEKVFKEAVKAGCDKILVTDGRFDTWIRKEKSLVGEGCKFATEKDLDAAVSECVSAYCNEKGFFGIQLLDEPIYDQFVAYGELMRSIKRVLPGVYIQSNLLPLGARQELLIPRDASEKDIGGDDRIESEQIGYFDVYKKYIGDFQKITGADNIHFDEYPFRREYIISGNTLPNYQVAARLCRDRNLEFRVVLQSFANAWNGTEHNRRMTESDMYWQTNLALGFGASEFSFYTYMAKSDFRYKDGAMGEIDGAAFVNLDGSKTELYGYTKRIISEMKKFLTVSEKYGYESSHIVCENGKTYDDFDWTRYVAENEKCPLSVSVDKGVALVTRQVNGNDELYMFENIGNVRDELFDGVLPMRLKALLPDGNKKFYFRGEEISATQNADSRYEFSLKVGDAVFVEITRSKD